jgi:hypothetical protein
VRLSFAYRFRTDQPHRIAGSGAIGATLSDGSGWRRALPLETARTFSGDTVTLRATLDVRRLQALVHEVVAETGTDAGSYTLTLRPLVRVHGQVDGRPLRDRLAGSYGFRLDPIRLAPAGGSGTAAPGFGVARWTPGVRSAPNDLSFLRVDLGVESARTLSMVLLALAAVGLAGAVALLLGARRADEESRIRARYATWLVDVAEARTWPRANVVRVDSFDDLLRLADRYERMILDEGGRFVVEDGQSAYVYDVVPEPAQADYGWDEDELLPADGWA